MRNGLFASALLLAVMFPVLPLRAQTASRPQAGAAQAVPDLSGIWEATIDLAPGDRPRSDICGEPACDGLLKRPLAHDVIVEAPQMLPWAEEKHKAAMEGVPEGIPFRREEADLYFSACTPLGPSATMLAFFNAVEVRQFPDVVLLFFGGIAGEADHGVRRIYLDGRGHPPNLKPTWMGHSIGRYEGDTLVVDTIGIISINGNRFLDLRGHPHTDALRLAERFRRVDQKTLEYEVTIDDPKAYKNTWRIKIVREMAHSGPRFWDDSICEELLQMGTHYGAEARK